MGVIESVSKTSDKAFHSGEDYVQATRKYYKLKVFYEITKACTTLVKALLFGSIFFLGIIFLTVAGALYLGAILGSTALACVCIAAFLFVCTGIGILFRAHIDRNVIKKMSDDFFD